MRCKETNRNIISSSEPSAGICDVKNCFGHETRWTDCETKGFTLRVLLCEKHQELRKVREQNINFLWMNLNKDAAFIAVVSFVLLAMTAVIWVFQNKYGGEI